MTTELDTLRTMLADAINDTALHRVRLEDYREDFNSDPCPLTESMIRRTEQKITNGEIRVKALGYAVDNLKPNTEETTFDGLIKRTLAVFPNAVLSEDTDGNIIIIPGFYEIPGKPELGSYKPE